MNPIDAGDETQIRRALELAARGSPTDVNPLVGAVVTDAAGAVIGEGYHRGAGTPHAEIEALRAAGPAAQGGTVYVTLEPCHHTGRTGPCVEALIAARVARVVFAQADPNPVAAGGSQRLRAAGVPVRGGVLAAEAEAVNRTWTHLMLTGRPFVTWKFAATLDGRSAARDGTSRWITGPEAREDVHALRARCGAVIVGTGTVLADDPQLTARGPGVAAPTQPLRVVLGTRDLPAGAHVLDDAAPTLILKSHDLPGALTQLAQRGVHHALLEGGPTLAGAFLLAGLVDEVVAYLAPALLGAGRTVVGDLGIGTIAGALRFTTTDVVLVGSDVRVTAAPSTAPRRVLGMTEQAGSRVQEAARTLLPTAQGRFQAVGYLDRLTGSEHLALVSPLGVGGPEDPPLVRVQSECLTGDVFGSQRCDCGPQLQRALDLVCQGPGVIVYLRGHEGRGVGLLAKLRAYQLQDQGLDTVAAQVELGLPVDAREYGAASGILHALGATRVRLLTNNPRKVLALRADGIEVTSVRPLRIPPTPENLAYLRAKRDQLGHDLVIDASAATQATSPGEPSVDTTLPPASRQAPMPPATT